jgi:hypothetical protein
MQSVGGKRPDFHDIGIERILSDAHHALVRVDTAIGWAQQGSFRRFLTFEMKGI